MDGEEILGPGAAIRYSPAAEVLRGVVLGYLEFSFECTGTWRLIVPDGIAKIALSLGGALHVVDHDAATTSAALVQGLRTTPARTRHHGRLHTIVVLLDPLGAYRVLGAPCGQWSQGTHELAELLGPAAARLAEQLAERPTWHERVRLLDQVLAARARGGPDVSPEVAWAWRELTRTGGQTRVDALYTGIGWSRRRLERRFSEQVGLPPKAAAGVLRLQHALREYRSGHRLADAAASAGYYDQSHFIRSCKEMLGRAPSKLDGSGLGARDRLTELVPGRLSTIPMDDCAG